MSTKNLWKTSEKPLKNLRRPRTFQEPLGGFPEVFKCCPFENRKPLKNLLKTSCTLSNCEVPFHQPTNNEHKSILRTRRLNRSRPKSALGAASITSMTAYYTRISPENHQVACPIEVYSVEEYRCLMVLPERVLYQQEVSKRFLKTSRWSTYFVYVRPPKTRGFPEVFQRFFRGFWF